MKTQSVVLTTEWQQLTDGTQTRILQVPSHSFALTASDTQPMASDPYYTLTDMVTVGPPHKWWIKALDWKNTMVVTV